MRDAMAIVLDVAVIARGQFVLPQVAMHFMRCSGMIVRRDSARDIEPALDQARNERQHYQC